MRLTLTTILLAAVTALLFTSLEKNNAASFYDGTKDLFVLVKYKAQPGKHEEALSALNVLILEVKKEPNFVNIKLFVDPLIRPTYWYMNNGQIELTTTASI